MGHQREEPPQDTGYPVWAWVMGALLLSPLVLMLIASFVPRIRRFLGFPAIAIFCVLTMGTCIAVLHVSNQQDDTMVPAPDEEGQTSQGETIYVNAADRAKIIVTHENPGYQQVFTLLGGDGSHQISDERWLQVMDILGYATSTPEHIATLEAEQARWMEQQVHHANVFAFLDTMASINEDRVIDQTELDQICFLRAQWEAQLTAARDYVQQYRRDDPETVEKNPGLGDLQERAERGLEVIELAESACP